MSTRAIRFEDEPLIRRIDRVRDGRGDGNRTKTARDLLHERLLELEQHGDPAAIAFNVSGSIPTEKPASSMTPADASPSAPPRAAHPGAADGPVYDRSESQVRDDEDIPPITARAPAPANAGAQHHKRRRRSA